jgi:glucose/arabinose dehydrogenase
MRILALWIFLGLGLAQVGLLPVAQGLTRPVGLVQEPGKGLLVLLQAGRVVELGSGRVWIDVSERVGCCGERGLLGLAFHPRYPQEPKFYLNYTNKRGDTEVWEYREKRPVRRLLLLKQPFANHNGGHLAFGPDGRLYVGTGDGGGQGDPLGHAQDPRSLFGKMLRIDVRRSRPRAEVWALGLRNPWRYSFDRETGDLYIADVGQDAWEEVNFVPRGQGRGWNFGWNVMEGQHCYSPAKGCNRLGLVLPVMEYGHDEGCSITGGYVYRGGALPELYGKYVFGDFCSGRVWAGVRVGGRWARRLLLNTSARIASFVEDDAGELYLVDYQGSVFRLVPAR